MVALKLKRIYDESAPDDGVRVLVDRMWPRGIKKSDANIDQWLKELAPSRDLRKWFNHDPDKWDEFRERYFEELDEKQDLVAELGALAGRGGVTLLFAAKDTDRNNAVALKEYLKRVE